MKFDSDTIRLTFRRYSIQSCRGSDPKSQLLASVSTFLSHSYPFLFNAGVEGSVRELDILNAEIYLR